MSTMLLYGAQVFGLGGRADHWNHRRKTREGTRGLIGLAVVVVVGHPSGRHC
jgi:hypothetical protein